MNNNFTFGIENIEVLRSECVCFSGALRKVSLNPWIPMGPLFDPFSFVPLKSDFRLQTSMCWTINQANNFGHWGPMSLFHLNMFWSRGYSFGPQCCSPLRASAILPQLSTRPFPRCVHWPPTVWGPKHHSTQYKKYTKNTFHFKFTNSETVCVQKKE